jgi:integrase/recombinase XerD
MGLLRGYVEGYYKSVAHFGTWLKKKHIRLKDINDNVVIAFAKHKCHCPGSRRTAKISKKYANRVQRFVLYLQQHDIISLRRPNATKANLPPLIVKFKESLHSRGLSPITIEHYIIAILKLLPQLGSNPKKYDVAIIHRVICDFAKKCSLVATKKLTTALRGYLRFLATLGICRPYLDAAVPTVAQWKLSSLPKYLMANELERIIASCNIDSQQGLRDRAIILLLCRLGLRAGDVSNMVLNDINWDEGTIQLCGKGRTEVILPLPQEVGDALLAYLEKARPKVPFKQIFLCLNAPYRPFHVSSSISSIVNAALWRAGIKNSSSSGANLLRHSAATAMLRKGSTLETVSAVLRHHSLNMTGYYAKVDIQMLKQIAQPWPEGAPC